MEFGRVPYNDLKETDFILPISDQPFLTGKRVNMPKIHIGFPKWSHEEWLGKFYPIKTKDADTLSLYATQFNTLEFNATHYRFFPDTQFEKWLNKVYGNEFTFCPKFPQVITHKGKITPAAKATETDLFLNGIITFKEKLGPAFLQVSEYYRIKDKQDLLVYLKSLPPDLLIFAETRHKSWFESEAVMHQFSNELNQLGKGWIITDTPGRRETTHMQLSIPKAFIRFVCMGDEEIDLFRIDQWKKVLTNWYDNGLEDCWFFLHVIKEAAAKDFSEFVKMELEPLIK
jgi:uncharacterized protein YecE (DUF72 family)